MIGQTSGLLGPDGRPLKSTINSEQGTLNNNWYHWASQWADYVVNPDTIPLSEYERMEETDETVFSGLEFLTQSILSRIGEFEHSVPRIQEFVRVQFEQMKGSFKWLCAEILKALQYGFSVSEIVWRPSDVNGAKVRLHAIQTLHPTTISFQLHKEGIYKNELSQIWQFQYGTNSVLLPINKCIHYAHRGSYGNPHGKSRSKRAYKAFVMKDIIFRAMGLAMERYGTPLTIASTTGNLSNPVQYQGKSYTGAEWLGMQFDALGQSGSLILPNGTTAEVKYSPGNIGRDFIEVIRYCNRSIHQAIGLPSLIADAGSVGSYSLGQAHSDTFKLLLENILDDLIEVLLEQLIRPLIEFQFGPQESYGDFSTSEFDASEALLIAQASKALIDCQLVDKERLDDYNKLRALNGFPPVTEEDLSAQFPGMNTEDMVPDSMPGMPSMPRPGVADAQDEEFSRRNPRFTHASSLAGRRQRRLYSQQQRLIHPTYGLPEHLRPAVQLIA